jgi:hypothetical protein
VPQGEPVASANAGWESPRHWDISGPAWLRSPFGMRTTLLPFLSVLILVSCGRAPDPQFSAGSGDLGIFLLSAISNREPSRESSNSFPIQTTWQLRLLTSKHKSGEYLDGRQALQVATDTTNFTSVQTLLNGRLGPAVMPLSREQGGWRQIGWRTDRGVGIWLRDDGQHCEIEIVKPNPDAQTVTGSIV